MIIEKLTKVWEQMETKQLAKIFEEYMQSMGIRKYDRRRKNNVNTYIIDGKTTNWNKVEIYYQKESLKFGEENLSITLRKRSGNYFIIQKKSIRAFEVDYSGVRHYDECLLNEIYNEHKQLFDNLFQEIDI